MSTNFTVSPWLLSTVTFWGYSVNSEDVIEQHEVTGELLSRKFFPTVEKHEITGYENHFSGNTCSQCKKENVFSEVFWRHVAVLMQHEYQCQTIWRTCY